MNKISGLLMSTAILGPIAAAATIGLTKVEAATAPQTTTVVINKMEGQGSIDYSGNGEQDSTWWANQTGWTAQPGTTFQAIRIGGLFTKTNGVPELKAKYADQLSSHILITPASDEDGGYQITVVKGTPGTADYLDNKALAKLLTSLEEDAENVASSTNIVTTIKDGSSADSDSDNGVINFNGLSTDKDNDFDNFYAFVETVPGEETTDSGMAVPVILELPRTKDDGKTWFDADNNKLYLYPKDVKSTALLNVSKQSGEDEDDSKTLSDSTFVLFNKTNAISDTTWDGYATSLFDGTKTITDLIGEGKPISSADGYVDSTSSNTNGLVSFTDLKPGETYYLRELNATDNYLTTGDEQKVEISRADGTFTNPIDTTGKTWYVDFATGNEVERSVDDGDLVTSNPNVFENYSTPKVDKMVDADGYYGKQTGFVEKDVPLNPTTGETSIGQTRGDRFNYELVVNIPENIGDYTEFNVIDDLPFQIDLESVHVNVSDATTDQAKTVLGSYQNRAGGPSISGAFSDANYTYTSIFDGYQRSPQRPITDEQGTHYIAGVTGVGGNLGPWYATDSANPEDGQSTTNAWDPATGTQIGGTEILPEGNGLNDITGTNSIYDYLDNFHTVTDQHTDGTINLSFDPQTLQNYVTESGANTLIIRLGVATNGAAQSDIINNNAKIEYKSDTVDGTTPGSLPKRSDTSATFSGGWEIVKTENGVTNVVDGKVTNGLADAKFILRRHFTAEEAAAIGLDGDDTHDAVPADGYLYFAHIDNHDSDDVEMQSDPTDPMGDIYWVSDINHATKHLSGSDGYLQYCGLGAGDYTLIETDAPTGFDLAADRNFTLGSTDTTTGTTGMGGDINGIADATDLNVVNYSKGEFPITGGIGALVFIALGGGLVATGLKVKSKKATK
ncbi:MAG: hypothetical protein LBM27_05375 [Lactobacillaceae bacterium]|jgi:hypothetical protein|nr:hypothetical protein [Lactobacillaceae bacterium]